MAGRGEMAQEQGTPANNTAWPLRLESPVDMADPLNVVVRMGHGWPDRVTINAGSCDPWFRMMADTTRLSDEELGKQDIGSLNLKAAVGLPGAERTSVHACVQVLNDWAKQVRAYTEDRWHTFERSPAGCNHSAAQFSMSMLAAALRDQLGVPHNDAFPEGPYDPADSRDLFLHGLLSGAPQPA